MVKFAVLREGLKADVRQRYDDFLYDQTDDKQRLKIQTVLVCSLLDMSNIQIDKQRLEDMGLYNYATELESSILYPRPFGSKELWKTIHPRWDMELLSFLYDSDTDHSLLEKRKRYLENALKSLFEF